MERGETKHNLENCPRIAGIDPLYKPCAPICGSLEMISGKDNVDACTRVYQTKQDNDMALVTGRCHQISDSNMRNMGSHAVLMMTKSPTSPVTNKNYEVKEFTLIVSTGCINAHDRAHERPPANADLRTLPAGISTGGGTATTVAASNQILLNIPTKLFFIHSINIHYWSSW